jgi:uncharacterized protein involved in response to NO
MAKVELIPLGFLTAGSAIVFAHGQPGPANIRAWLVGAVGTLTLAAMTRVDVSREGRPASVRVMAYVIYLAAGAGIVLRLFTGWSEIISAIAGAAWVVAFAVFVLGYLPLLVRPRTATP